MAGLGTTLHWTKSYATRQNVEFGQNCMFGDLCIEAAVCVLVAALGFVCGCGKKLWVGVWVIVFCAHP